MPSQKPKIFEHLFEQYWDQASRSLTKTDMSLEDVAQAIRECNAAHKTKLSDRNPANFMKDYLRLVNASEIWPESIANRRFTAIQRTGGGCFEFIPYQPDQTEPFPDIFKVRIDAPRYPIQSISIPSTTKSLGRSDETWLIQTAVNLRIVETHFAISSDFPIFELTHLQMGIKLHKTEIDALFLGKTGEPKDSEFVLVTCEAKQASDRIIPSQIINQIQAGFSESDFDTVVPIGLKRIKGIGFYLIEFEAVKRDDAPYLEELTLAKDAIYELHPPVKGI